MKKYYKIPMTERIVQVNTVSLFQILQEHYPDLYNRELGRIELTYGGDNPGVMTPQLEEMVNEYNAETKALYKAMGVPQYIIGFKNEDDVIVEYATKTPLDESGLGCFISGREVSQTEAYTYLDDEKNYIEVVNRFFPKKEKPKSIGQRVIEVITGKKDN